MANPEDDGGKGFKGLGKLAGQRPPAPPEPPPGDAPLQLPPPSPPSPESPQSPPPQSPRRPVVTSRTQPGGSGCGKAALVIVLVLGLGFGLLLAVGWWASKNLPDESAAPVADAAAPYADDTQDTAAAEAEAALAAATAQVELGSTLAHVASSVASVRDGATDEAAMVAKLPKWTEVNILSDDGDWAHVDYPDGDTRAQGWLRSGLLVRGGAEAGRTLWCREKAGTRPASGEVLEQADEGGHTLKVNAGPRDALVKLRQDGETLLAFYVRAHETGEVANVADGSYQVMFATGEDFSRRCLEFTTDMSVSADPDPLVLEVSRERTAQGTMVYHSVMEYTLTLQQGGNFRPEDVDPADFRE